MNTRNTIELNYVIANPRAPVTLDLYEAESYEPAIIVQSLVGNLVYYSNFGRYEPRLAKKWQRQAPNIWMFELFENLKDENGKEINAKSFKSSLERTIRYLSKIDSVPIIKDLIGFTEYVSGQTSDLAGIEVKENRLYFKFSKAMRDGVLQILSFAPFGYISSENLNSDGSWKDSTRFVSSGPYKVKSYEKNKRIELIKNSHWQLDFAQNAPDVINFTFEIPKTIDSNANYIVDTFTSKIISPLNTFEFALVPEYINSILLGNLNNGLFSDIDVRRLIKLLIKKEKLKLSNEWDSQFESDYFYPNQSMNINFERIPEEGILFNKFKKINTKNKVLQIEGLEPAKGTTKFISWKILKQVLSDLGLHYTFVNNPGEMKFVTNKDYDIRIQGSSIGGGAEAWGLEVVFCSDLGPRFPDPSGEVCNSIVDFNSDKISSEEFSRKFNFIVDRDAAIIPISHYGVRLYLTQSINRSSISPTLSIMRFDKLEIN